MTISNIISIYKKASPNDLEEGKNWYKSARSFCQDLGKLYDIPTTLIAGVVSALSPRNKWEYNLEDAIRVVMCFKEGGDRSSVKVRTFNKNRDKAFQILDTGSVEPVKKSNKTRCFLDNISNENSLLVTVDTHAVSIYNGERTKASCINNSLYEQISHAYIDASNMVGLLPHELQAITWLTYRRSIGIK